MERVNKVDRATAKMLCVRVHPDLVRRVKRRIHGDGVTMEQWVAFAIDDALRRWGDKETK
jgi:hypothetical protein